jgi:HEPN domain-containing protein
MPWIEMALSRVNHALHPDNRGDLDQQIFAPGQSVEAALKALGLEDDERVWEAVRQFPDAISEAFRAALHSGLTRQAKGAITVAWIASYDYGLEVYESQSFDNSPAGLTIVVRSRYPFDRHPASRGGRAAV